MKLRSLSLCTVVAVAVMAGAPVQARDVRDEAPDDWAALQGGRLTSNTAFTDRQDLNQWQYGARVAMTESGDFWAVREEIGILKCASGWLLDSEFWATGTIPVGSAVLQPFVPVGLPIAVIGAPYYFNGFDITLGAGLEAKVPLGPLWLEARGQAAFNFLSVVAGFNGDPYDASNGSVSARQAMLLYRLVAAVWIPIERTPVRLEVRRDSFSTWWMTAVGLGAAF